MKHLIPVLYRLSYGNDPTGLEPATPGLDVVSSAFTDLTLFRLGDPPFSRFRAHIKGEPPVSRQQTNCLPQSLSKDVFDVGDK